MKLLPHPALSCHATTCRPMYRHTATILHVKMSRVQFGTARMPCATYLTSYNHDGAQFIHQYAVACCVAQLRADLLQPIHKPHHPLHGCLLRVYARIRQVCMTTVGQVLCTCQSPAQPASCDLPFVSRIRASHEVSTFGCWGLLTPELTLTTVAMHIRP